MAKFWQVYFWPPANFPDAVWEDPDTAAWLGTSRRVCEAYSAGLRESGLTGRHSTLRLRADASGEDLAAGGVVRAGVTVDRFDSYEFGRVQVPRGVARLSPAQRAELVLHTVHLVTRELGRYRGWDAAALQAVHDQVLADGCAFEGVSGWKANPGRSRRARVVFTLADDGHGRVVLEVAQPDGAVARVGPALGLTTLEGFGGSTGTLRWHGKDAVELVLRSGPFGDERGLLRWAADGSGFVDAVHEDDAAIPAARIELANVSGRVVVRAEGDTLPDTQPQIRVIGGGPTNDVPEGYSLALDLLLEAVRGEPWQQWWAASGETILRIWYHFAAPAAGHRIRRAGGRVNGWIDRPTPTMIAADDRVQLAIDDVTGLMAAIGSRFNLGPLPALPPYEALLEQASTLLAARESQQ